MTEQSAIMTRLDQLPRKTSIPFRELLSRGYISEQILDTILDAGEIAVDSSKLFGFAIGYLHLRTSGVPILDVVRMSRNLGRKIRLDWSIARWRSEHDRLSRAETLSRLSEEIVSYDVSDYDAVITHPYPGYLIRSSRRLGMEGLRQRHCVASYHRQLAKGTCAIASVFVDKERWSVQLQLTSNSEAPLRISQIRSRFNAQPTPLQRAAIFEMFRIEELATMRTDAPRPVRGIAHPYMRNLRRVLPVLRANQVTEVVVTFDGYGDSGSIDAVAYMPDSFDPSRCTTQFVGCTNEYVDGEWVSVAVERLVDLDQAITDLTYDYLEETGCDWYNNDGGFGELVINVDAGTIKMEVNSRFTDSTTEYQATRDIETGDQID